MDKASKPISIILNLVAAGCLAASLVIRYTRADTVRNSYTCFLLIIAAVAILFVSWDFARKRFSNNSPLKFIPLYMIAFALAYIISQILPGLLG